MRAKLTPAFVAKPPVPVTGRTIFWDDALTGLGLMVTKNGRKSYVVDYRAAGRKRRMHLKAGLSVTDARREAKAILGSVAKGGDPLSDRRRAKRAASDTFKAIIEEYFRREGGRLRSADYRRRVLERLVLPTLGDRQVNDITRTDIIRLLDKIADLPPVSKPAPDLATLSARASNPGQGGAHCYQHNGLGLRTIAVIPAARRPPCNFCRHSSQPI